MTAHSLVIVSWKQKKNLNLKRKKVPQYILFLKFGICNNTLEQHTNRNLSGHAEPKAIFFLFPRNNDKRMRRHGKIYLIFMNYSATRYTQYQRLLPKSYFQENSPPPPLPPPYKCTRVDVPVVNLHVYVFKHPQVLFGLTFFIDEDFYLRIHIDV